MPRPNTRGRRSLLPHHLYNQGFSLDGKHPRKVFVDDEDRQYFLSLLARHLGQARSKDSRGRWYQHLCDWITLHAYCVLTTHFHLIVWQLDPNGIAELMNRVTAAYTRYFNQKYGNIKPLFRGPVCSKPIDNREYFKWLVGYVHENHPDGVDYRFSSHGAWLDPDLRPDWLRPEPAIAVFGGLGGYREYLDKRASKKQIDFDLGFGSWVS